MPKKKPLMRILMMDQNEDFNFDKRLSNEDGESVKGAYSNDRIGALIKQARLALGMSMAELSARSGIDESTLAKIEKDASSTRMLTLRKIIEIGLNGQIQFIIRLR